MYGIIKKPEWTICRKIHYVHNDFIPKKNIKTTTLWTIKPPYGQLNIDWLFGSHKSNICTSTDGYNL